MTATHQNSSRTFASGFTFGLLFGVAGYYLFGTKQGEKTRKKLAQEWDDAHQHLIDQGILNKNTKCKNLGDLVQLAKNGLLKELGVETEKAKPSRKKRNYTRKTKQKQFKGV